ncbi:hypothetical protein [Chitinophaga sp. S165]|nr:hypothetical protein [Chitinophaga sp. S165]
MDQTPMEAVVVPVQHALPLPGVPAIAQLPVTDMIIAMVGMDIP